MHTQSLLRQAFFKYLGFREITKMHFILYSTSISNTVTVTYCFYIYPKQYF